MQILDDYVKWIAESLGVILTDKETERIRKALTKSEKYTESLHELESFILTETGDRIGKFY